MFAIIETGGKQYKVNEGDVIFVEKLECAEGEKVVFDKVLAVGADDGFKAGKPDLQKMGAKKAVSKASPQLRVRPSQLT